jgi:hypothetical protein
MRFSLLAIGLFAMHSSAAYSQDCRSYPPGEARLACIGAKNPGIYAKRERCKEEGLRMGLSTGKGGGMKSFVQACMQRR